MSCIGYHASPRNTDKDATGAPGFPNAQTWIKVPYPSDFNSVSSSSIAIRPCQNHGQVVSRMNSSK